MGRPPKGRSYLSRSEVSLLYSLILAMDEHKRNLIWDFEIFPHTPIADQHVRERLGKFSAKSGLLQRQTAPNSRYKGWLWCSVQSVEDYLYGELKNHPEKILGLNKAFPDRPGWSPDDILKALEERKERNGIRKSEGESTPASAE